MGGCVGFHVHCVRIAISTYRPLDRAVSVYNYIYFDGLKTPAGAIMSKRQNIVSF